MTTTPNVKGSTTWTCAISLSTTTYTQTQLKITTDITVDSTSALINAWETKLTDDAHKSMGSVTMKLDTAYAYFGRSIMMYVNKDSISTATALTAVAGTTTTSSSGALLGVQCSLAAAAAAITAYFVF